ncbi:hypothetical protein AMATHDRAFT_145973 [Amanita thiersii Skay4041]|uniref:Transmembrane protein n=1 Tax=Amanita thiersii Skay4041 TaxID=703135 RepID=A0A2A9NGI4_9AGAR|nr:hypothetical protein AMATHDRAFT_145973 [Amanita thiersii Skay4041]
MSNYTIFNDSTPLLFVPHEVARKYEISRHIYVGTLGAFLWDAITHIYEEYDFLFKHKLGIPTIAYVISRIVSLAYVIACVVYAIAPVGDCQKLQVAIGWCFCIAISSTTSLLLIRVYQLFKKHKIVVAAFSVLWLSVLGGSMTVPFSTFARHIEPTNYCINSGVNPESSVGVITSTVNDIFVVGAVTWKIVHAAQQSSSQKFTLRDWLNTKTIVNFSIQTGQQYYLISVLCNIMALVVLLHPAVPPVLHGAPTVPNIALMNSMACRVHRNVRFGVLTSKPTMDNRLSAGLGRNGSILPVNLGQGAGGYSKGNAYELMDKSGPLRGQTTSSVISEISQ